MAMLVITRGYIIMTHLRICTPQTPGLVHQEDPRRCLLRWRCLKRPGQAKDSMVWDKNWASWGCQRHEMEWGVHGRVTCRWWEKMKSLRTAKDVDGSSVESGVWGTSESLIEMAPWRYTQKKHMFLTNPELLYGKTPGWCNPHESHVVASFFSISLWYSHMLSPYYIIYPHKMVAQSFIITMVMRCNKITRASILIQGIQGIQGALFVKHCTAWGQAEQGCSQQLLVWVVNGVKI